MKKTLAAVAALALAIILSACGPSREEVACEESGGVYVAHVVGYYTTYILVGKVMVPQQRPLYEYICERA